MISYKTKQQKTKIAFFEIDSWEKTHLQASIEKGVSKKLLKRVNLKIFKKPLTQKIINQVQDIEILGIFINSKIDKAVLEKLPKLKFITTMSVGFDHIDLGACAKQGIMVSNVPSYGENTIAEHTFALILALARKLPQVIEEVRKGDFTLDNLRSFDLEGKTIGIIGLGRIGSCAAKIAQGFGMKILAYDIRKNPKLIKKLNLKLKYVTLDYLLSYADIVSLHANYNPANHYLINKNNIKKFKKGALLINTARGGLVETEALLLALKKGILSGVGLDVLEEEGFLREEKELLTKKFQQKYNLKTILQTHLLREHPKVIITPHIAFNSREALSNILETTIKNILGFLDGKPINLVKKSLS